MERKLIVAEWTLLSLLQQEFSITHDGCDLDSGFSITRCKVTLISGSPLKVAIVTEEWLQTCLTRAQQTPQLKPSSNKTEQSCLQCG
jgi:hypothetical protein